MNKYFFFVSFVPSCLMSSPRHLLGSVEIFKHEGTKNTKQGEVGMRGRLN
jgi:hypothetical protein